MKKYVLLFILCLWGGVIPASASSILYTFSSGDILAKNANDIATYGLGRIDFVNNLPVPKVVLSGDRKSHALGEFTRNGKRYIYDQKVQKPNEDTAYFDVYDASRGIDSPLAKDLMLTVTPNAIASADLKLAPDSTGYVYAIINGTTLIRYDLLNWNSTVTQTLPSGYDVYSLVALTDHENVLYMWASKRTKQSDGSYVKSDGSYVSEKSDIIVYNRATLELLNTFSFVRTGLDSTSKLVDDQSKTATKPELEVGRGLVAISNTATDKSVVLVAYDTDSKDAPAKIVRIDETANPTITCEVIVRSSDIEYRRVDNESPIPDENGGFYFGCYSGDANAEAASADSKVYHWNNTKKLTVAPEKVHTTADLVIKEGTHKGSIVVFKSTGASVDLGGTQNNYTILSYIWNGVTNTPTTIDNGSSIGVELEKPFSDGKDGIYFMMETTLNSEDMDALYHWNGSNVQMVHFSAMELEVENPPSDGNNGFYFVETELRFNVKTSADLTNLQPGMVSTDMKLYHCTGRTTSLVCDLGVFRVPDSSFVNASGDKVTDFTSIKELIQSEHGFLEDTEHEMLFVGAGPIGGDMNLKVFTWNATTKQNLSSADILKEFTNKDLGGYADVATALFFSESHSSLGDSGGGCNTGAEMFGLIGLSLTALMTYRRKTH